MLKALGPLLLLGLPALAQDQPLGTWTGTGFQVGDSWDMEVTFVPGAARVDYPEFPCGGVWVLDQLASGTEWLTYGKSVCIDGLALRLQLTGPKTMRVSYIKGIDEVAYGELTKVSPTSGKKSN